MTAYETELAAGPLGNLQGAVSEHSRWLELNCSSQLDYYTRFVADREQGGSGMDIALMRECGKSVGNTFHLILIFFLLSL